MVQKRRSHLERIRHAHPVYLGQYVSRKVGFCVEILHFAQGVRGGTVFQKGQKRVVRRRLSVCPCQEIFGIDVLFPPTRQHGYSIQIALPTGQGKVVNKPATARACSLSLKSRLGKPMENVLTGRELNRAISATTMEESTPPLRSAPRGTSLSRRIRTASAMRCSSSSRHSCSDGGS